VWRTCSLAFLVLTSCRDQAQDRQNFNVMWNNARRDSDIETLKRQVADLQKQDAFQDNELVALAQSQAETSNTVVENAKIANANGKLADDRWNYIRQRLPQ
jgi:hypothetical protein